MSARPTCPACKHALPTGQILSACPYCGRKLKVKAKPATKGSAGTSGKRAGGQAAGSVKKSRQSAGDEVNLDDLINQYEEDEYVAPLPAVSGGKPIDKRLVMMIAGGVLLLGIVVTAAYLITLMGSGSGSSGSNNTRSTISALPTAPPAVEAPAPVMEAPVNTGQVAAAAPQFRRITPRYASLVASLPGENVAANVVSEKAITDALQKGLDFLISQYKDGQFPETENPQYRDGMACLSLQALLHAGRALDDRRVNVTGPLVSNAIEQIKQFKMETHYAVYSRSLRMSALALAGRIQDRPTIAADLEWMTNTAKSGGFGYSDTSGNIDNSNSQYGALGYWGAHEAGLTVSSAKWAEVWNYWNTQQTVRGGWPYSGGSGAETQSMTAAGISTMALVEMLTSPDAASKPVTLTDPVQRGIAWLAAEDRMVNLPGMHYGYTLYGIERAGLATGYRYFGDKDWFLTLAPLAMANQQPDGSWNGNDTPIGETAFRLLFLSRGSHPILMSKLQFDGNWRNRPADVGKLAGWAGPMLERSFNWQIVPITQPWQNWTGSPVVYLASDKAPNINDNGLAQLRGFAEHGGIVFTHADRSSKEFNDWIEATAPKIFPGFAMVDVPADHPVYTVAAKIQRKPPLRMLTNGSRVLLIHSPTDLAGIWDQKFAKSNPDGLGLGLNVAVYATGLNPFRNRLQTIYEAEQRPASGLFPIARVQYEGKWNGEPAAWENFGRWMQSATGIGIKEEPVAPANLDFFQQPIAHLTGMDKFTFSTEFTADLSKYISAGGILVVDATGGSSDFAESAMNLCSQMLTAPGASAGASRHITPEDPLVTPVSWGTIPAIETRASVGGRPQGTNLAPQVFPLGKGFIIYTDRDLTTGLMGANVWNMHGYTVGWSRALTKNLILAAIDRGKRIAMDVPVE